MSSPREEIRYSTGIKSDTKEMKIRYSTGIKSPRQKPKNLSEIKHFAKMSRQVILRWMAPDQCLITRVYSALVLWSWCGPEKTEDGKVVVKDAGGYIERDKNGEPIRARQRDIFRLLDLRSELRGHLSRAVARLIADGLVWTDDDDAMYIDPDPPAFDGESDTSTDEKTEWVIADRHISSDDLPTEPDKRAAAIEWLDAANTAWNAALKDLRTSHRSMLVQGLSERGIFIDKRSRRESNNNMLVVVAPPVEVPRPKEPELSPVLAALQQHGITTPAAAENLATACRNAKPGCTDAEIVETIQAMAAGFSRTVNNPVGVLLTQVPQAIAARPRPPSDLVELRRRLRSSDPNTSAEAARLILADQQATPQDRTDANDVLEWTRNAKAPS